MPITADLGGKNYTLGKGKVFFDRYPANAIISAITQGEGERYLGNAPEFSTSISSENLDHYSSAGGIKVKDDSVQLSVDSTGKVSCDNVGSENVALYFLGTSAIVAQAALVAQVTLVTGAKRGRFYQLGVSETNPAGLRNVSAVVVKKGAGFTTTVVPAANYEVDEVLGRLYVLGASPDIDTADIQVTFNTAATSRTQVVSGSSSIYGAMRFVSDNPKGENRDYYFPYVKLAPDGDYPLIGDEWMSMSFSFEVLKKASNIASVYIDGRPS